MSAVWPYGLPDSLLNPAVPPIGTDGSLAGAKREVDLAHQSEVTITPLSLTRKQLLPKMVESP